MATESSFVASRVSGTLRTKIQNNTVAAPLVATGDGIRVDSGNGLTGENTTVCLNIQVTRALAVAGDWASA